MCSCQTCSFFFFDLFHFSSAYLLSPVSVPAAGTCTRTSKHASTKASKNASQQAINQPPLHLKIPKRQHRTPDPQSPNMCLKVHQLEGRTWIKHTCNKRRQSGRTDPQFRKARNAVRKCPQRWLRMDQAPWVPKPARKSPTGCPKKRWLQESACHMSLDAKFVDTWIKQGTKQTRKQADKQARRASRKESKQARTKARRVQPMMVEIKRANWQHK